MTLAYLILVSFLSTAAPTPEVKVPELPCVVVFGHHQDEPLLRLSGYARMTPEGSLYIRREKTTPNDAILGIAEASFPPLGWEGVIVTPPENCSQMLSEHQVMPL